MMTKENRETGLSPVREPNTVCTSTSTEATRFSEGVEKCNDCKPGDLPGIVI